MSAINSAENAQASAEAKLLESYQPSAHAYDELTGGSGQVRPRWHPVLESFAALGDEATQAAQDKAQRLLEENDVTFSVQGDRDTSRPWRLDLFPLLIQPEEWTAIERGVVQRTQLLNRLLVDLYGPQRVLAERLLPPGLVFGNREFLRPCASIGVRDDLHLHFVAFDLARSADGSWSVVSDRTQAPSGAGYALENRVVSSQCLPEVFAERNVRRLASFFRAFSERFLSLSGRDQPQAVFLSPGPSKQNYFEHAYLARYLGFSVVEGSDLTVRDDRVYLKTVEGLKPVDLIMRRIASELCDPLELRTDSLVGVPGLVQAARAGKVTIGNALGSGLVESDSFLSFLPSLCRHYLNEELAMPSLATWWCGQERERRYVLEHLDELVVRRVRASRELFPRGQEGLFSPEMPAAERARVDSRDRAQRPRVHRPRAHLAVAGADLVRCERVARRAGVVARLRRGDEQRLRSHAGRAHACRRRHGSQRVVARDRRRQQGHVGAVRSTRRAIQPARATPSEHALAPRRPRLAEPHAPTACSGSVGTRSAPKAPCACCAAS